MAQNADAALDRPGDESRPRTLAEQGALSRAQLSASKGFYRRAWDRLRRDKIAMVALIFVVIIVAVSFGAPLMARFVTGWTYSQVDLRSTLYPPFTEGHLLGTDSNGRDILTRLLYGGRVSLTVAVLAALVALSVGALIGATAGFYGGIVDNILMRFVDIVISIPSITLLLLLSVWFRPGPVELAFIIAATSWTGLSRLVRGQVLSLRSRDFVDAARVIGAPNSRIILRHIMPNVLSVMVVWVSLSIPSLILTEAALSYLGFGVSIPTPSWGNMLDEAKEFYLISWTYVFIPGVTIFITALAFNLLGNGIRDALDPRLNN
ncbi:MAG TPA: ABC transporter permease [Thermomicrobiales bacterium]|jgi:peptide/nickel transport system permease protein|nr:ABC transporter permease [Thermomicrobiales bacterium]